MSKLKKNQKPIEPIEFDSDTESEDEYGPETETCVDVGYIDPDLYVESTESERKLTKTLMKSPFYNSKVGGKPSWLNFFQVPLAIETIHTSNNNETPPPIRMECNNCHKQLKFLLQLYCPISGNDKLFHQIENPDNVFHRVIYLFICANNECLPIRSRAIKVFRSQLKHKNDFFSESPAPCLNGGDGGKDMKVADDYLLEFYKGLWEKNLMSNCVVCGLACTKKCARCKFTNYCCQSHQVFDWQKENHKSVCEGYEHWMSVETDIDELFKLYIEKENAPGALSDLNQNLNEFVFPEFEIMIEPEVIAPVIAKKVNKKSEEEKLSLDLEANCALDQDLDNVKESECDRDFNKFTRRTRDEPTQIVRYDRGGQPLWVTKFEKIKKDSTLIPKCVHCGAARVFEFQVNPQLLNYLGVEDAHELSTIDWAGLYVYTCAKSCAAGNKTLVEEFVYKQDFS